MGSIANDQVSTAGVGNAPQPLVKAWVQPGFTP